MKPSILKFKDYREYLEELLKYLKSKKVSQRKLAVSIGVSPSYFTMVIKAKRKMSDEVSAELASYLSFNQKEKDYLNLLLLLNDSKTKDKKKAMKQLSANKSFISNNPSEHETYRYLSRWENVAIREMTKLRNFKLNPEWIKEKLVNSVSLKEVKESISFLIENQFIKPSGSQAEFAADKHVACVDGVYKLSLGEFHANMLDLADRSIGNTPSPERLILGHTVALSEDNFQESKKIMEEAIAKIRALEKKKSENSRVYHFELALFPLTKKEE